MWKDFQSPRQSYHRRHCKLHDIIIIYSDFFFQSLFLNFSCWRIWSLLLPNLCARFHQSDFCQFHAAGSFTVWLLTSWCCYFVENDCLSPLPSLIPLISLAKYYLTSAFLLIWNLSGACRGLNFISTKTKVLTGLCHVCIQARHIKPCCDNCDMPWVVNMPSGT